MKLRIALKITLMAILVAILVIFARAEVDFVYRTF